MAKLPGSSSSKPILQIQDLQVYYGESHALQGVSLTLQDGILSVVGRNGMGKTTLCNTIVGLIRARSGSIRFDGRDISGMEPHEISRAGIGFVPQGRRLWQSLSVDETLRLSARIGEGGNSWNVERIYATFPRLAERKGNGGGQLSGGEQQMLAISRALLSNPRLLVMDEPTEGLAPAIVTHVRDLLVRLASEEGLSVLVVEQNIGVATSVSDSVAIMVNGRINRIMEAGALASDRTLQQRLLGVGRNGEPDSPEPVAQQEPTAESALVYRVTRRGAIPGQDLAPPIHSIDSMHDRSEGRAGKPRVVADAAAQDNVRPVFAIPPSERFGRLVLLVGTFDTKDAELRYIQDRLRSLKVPVRTVDLSTSGKISRADVTPMQVAAMHPRGSDAVFSADRGAAVTAMSEAFGRWIDQERGVGGIISAGGSGGTALATAGMRRLPLGVPKIMISTVASGQVGQYVGSADIMMLHSVVDVQGVNSVIEHVLNNAANALAGAVAGLPTVAARESRRRLARAAIGITMFGVTTPAVQSISRRLGADFDCLVFHATGTGGRSMESLGDARLLSGFIDLTTTEVADMMVGGIFPADRDRFGAAIRTGLPFVGSVGALDMVNFGPRDTVPERFRNRRLVTHNPSVTLMRTTRDENRAIGEWMGGRFNMMEGVVRILLPERGLSQLDVPGEAFYDPEADHALFEALDRTVRQTSRRTIERIDANINDEVFVDAVVSAFSATNLRREKRA